MARRQTLREATHRTTGAVSQAPDITQKSSFELLRLSHGGEGKKIYFLRGERISKPNLSLIAPMIPFGATTITAIAIIPRMRRPTLG